MQDYEWWWVIAGVLGVAEVLTGTFYVLVLAIASVAGSFLAKAGLATHWQVLGAAMVTLLGWFWLRRRNTSAPNEAQALDVGEWIDIDSWTDGVGSAQYRGAHWSVEVSPETDQPPGIDAPSSLQPGKYRIQALRGNRLIVDRRR